MRKKLILGVGVSILGFILLFNSTFFIKCTAQGNVLTDGQLLKLLSNTIELVKNYYVDEVSFDKIITGAINGILESLDPHCTYISPEKAKKFEEEITGDFYGIGISYDFIGGFLTIINTIDGSPASKAGLRPGDKIIKINNHSIINVSLEEVKSRLNSEDKKIKLEIVRKDKRSIIYITKEKIHIKSIPYAYLLDDSTGYIKISTFGTQTYSEFKDALYRLDSLGMKQLIVDLRTNSGGLLDQAIKIIDLFLKGNQEIVSTKGRSKDFVEIFYSSDSIDFKVIPLILLISHQTASASEIFAGAIQDWDRGLVIGTRSFGKGLVQRQFPLGYGASILLTIAKYYTPSGRLIQRPYKSKKLFEYFYEDIDSLSADSSKVFYTKNKRKVYGGGGISPDYKLDWWSLSNTVEEIVFNEKRPLFKFAEKLWNEATLDTNFEKFEQNFHVDDSIMMQFVEYLKDNDIEVDSSELTNNIEILKNYVLKSIVAYQWGEEKADYIFNKRNKNCRLILSYFQEARKLAEIYRKNSK